jgi:hypothetical protein
VKRWWSEAVRGLALVGLATVPLAAGEVRAGIWISPEEVRRLPDSGLAWRALLEAADKAQNAPSLAERNSNDDVIALAKALAYVRTGDARYRLGVQFAISGVIGTERDGDVLALARNLPGYVIAAELVGLPARHEEHFRAWLANLLDRELDGQSLRRVHERRPNNWGTHAGGARVVIARYLGDQAELERVAQVFRGWCGERSAYDGFQFGDLTWQVDPAHPVGVNPRGAERDGHSLDGVLPDDQRRSGAFAWPPPKENYVYEALQGALLQAVVLERAGYDAFEWGDRALLRAALWLEREAGYPAEGDDTWQPHLLNYVYDANLRTVYPARPGKNVGWTDWTHFRGARQR